MPRRLGIVSLWLALSGVATAGPLEEAAQGLRAMRERDRREERRAILAEAERVDRLAALGERGAYRIAGELYLFAYRAHRELADLATAIDRLEHAASEGGEGEAGCDAALAVAAAYAEFGPPASGYLAFHRLRRRCSEGSAKDAADRGLAILARFRPDPAALASVDRDPAAPLPPAFTTAPVVTPTDAGPPRVDAGVRTAALDAGPSASARPRGKQRMIIRFTDASR